MSRHHDVVVGVAAVACDCAAGSRRPTLQVPTDNGVEGLPCSAEG